MRITWRDAATTAFAVVVVLVYLAHVASWAIPVVGDVRGATLMLGAVGFAMCIVGGSTSAVVRRDAFLAPLTVLGVGAFVVIAIGLISGWELIVPLLTADILLMWVMATMRHALATGPSPAPQT
jgi:hypothetical protein